MSHIYCPECGFQNPEAANYCAKCGALLHDRESESGEQTQQFDARISRPADNADPDHHALTDARRFYHR